MKITKEEVKHVARLARLELDEDEVERMTMQLGNILGYVAKLDEIDTGGVEPTTHTQKAVNAFREDVVRESLPRESVLANAPDDNQESFVVPKVIS